MTKERERLSFDDMMDALNNSRRRKLLLALLKNNPQDEAPAVIGDSDSETDAVELLVSMQHTHLPKLEEYGLIEWDKDAHEVMKGPKFDEIRPLLELLENHQDELPTDWI